MVLTFQDNIVCGTYYEGDVLKRTVFVHAITGYNWQIDHNGGTLPPLLEKASLQNLGPADEDAAFIYGLHIFAVAMCDVALLQ